MLLWQCMNQPTFLFSSFDPLPDQLFSGYCFIGTDFIYGGGGAELFTASTARMIDPGEDGCYVIVRKAPDGHIIGADFKGYKKLFLYRSGAEWAVSNSFIRLVSFLRDKGQSISIDDAQLAAWFVKGAFGEQLSSFATAVTEIRVVPSSCCLRITPSGCRLEDLPRGRSLPYAEALHTFLSVWIGRLKGLLLDPAITVFSHLTGGRDSRAVLALFLAIARQLGEGAPRVRYVSLGGSRDIDDLSVATALSRHFGLSLNESIGVERVQLDAKESYEAWRDLCIGVYAPIYFPTSGPSPITVTFGGGGGESHRPFYPLIAPSAFLEKRRKYFPVEHRYLAWKDEVLSAIRFLDQRAEAKTHPMILHYREFRDRFHVGRGAQYSVELLPLGSKLLHACSDAYQGSAEDGQVLFDVMQNLAPGLADMPYDNDIKLPSEQHRTRLISVDFDMPPPGRVFRSSRTQRTGAAASSKNQFLLLKESLDEALRESARLDFGEEYIHTAKRALDVALETGRFTHAADASPIHHLLLAEVVSAACR